jgi:hypothetical protein
LGVIGATHFTKLIEGFEISLGAPMCLMGSAP